MRKLCIISIDFRIFWALKNPEIRKNPENSHAWITIRWSHFQSARYKPLKLCLICRCGLPYHLAREPTASPVLTKCWNWELTLATNFGSHVQMVTKFGRQILVSKFGFVPDWLCSRNHAICRQTDGWTGRQDESSILPPPTNCIGVYKKDPTWKFTSTGVVPVPGHGAQVMFLKQKVNTVQCHYNAVKSPKSIQ